MSNHTINIHELCSMPKIIELEQQTAKYLKLSHSPEENFEKDQALQKLRHSELFTSTDNHDYRPILKARLEDLITRPCAVKAVKNCWHLPFNEDSFRQDVEVLSSKLNGIPMSIRTANVESLDLQTGLTAVRYPSVGALNKGIPIVASLLSKPCCSLHILSALIAWVYLYRLHLFEDGNGRLSRHILNIALRNYGLISEPKIFLSVGLYENMRSITEHMTGKNGDMPELITILYSQILGALQNSIHHHNNCEVGE